MWVSRVTVLSITLLVQLAAIIIFLQGFFPTKQKLPGFASWTDLPPEPRADTVEYLLTSHDFQHNKSYTTLPLGREYDRLVLMLVDAMRIDFVTERHEMNYTRSLIKAGQALVFDAQAMPPTVTMPRIKVQMYSYLCLLSLTIAYVIIFYHNFLLHSEEDRYSTTWITIFDW